MAKLYILTLEKLTSTAFPYLDLMITVLRKTEYATITFAPYTKPTPGKIPLGSDSCHPPEVHLTWPRADLQRIRFQCCTEGQFQKVREAYIEQFKLQNEPRPLLSFFSKHFVAGRSKSCISNELWIVFSYHPIFYKPFKRVVSELEWLRRHLDLAYGSHASPQIRIAWKSACVPLYVDSKRLAVS